MHFLLAPARLAGSGRIPHWSLRPVRDVRAAWGWHVSAGGLDAQSNKLRVDVIITCVIHNTVYCTEIQHHRACQQIYNFFFKRKGRKKRHTYTHTVRDCRQRLVRHASFKVVGLSPDKDRSRC